MSWLQSGTAQWWLQRISALVLLVYLVALDIASFQVPLDDYAAWQNMLSSLGMSILGTLALLALVIHAWIGLWIVATDYVPNCIRPWFQWVIRVISVVEMIWIILLFWG